MRSGGRAEQRGRPDPVLLTSGNRLTEEQQHPVDAREAVLPGSTVLDDPAWSHRRHSR